MSPDGDRAAAPRRGRSVTARAGLAALVALCGCNLYEGRTLDLFANGEPGLSECRSAPDCPHEQPKCAGGACVECLLDADCGPARPACVGNACVECRSANDCASNQSCNPVLLSCALTCTEQSECAGQPLTQCSPELDVCVQCVLDSDCDERRPACEPGGRCAECTGDQHCTADKPHCEPASHTCAECVEQSQCADGVCDHRDGRCVECLTDADCGGTTCDVGRRRCVRPCVGAGDCDPRHPVCDLGSGACIECMSDDDCMDPKRPACGLDHECAECSSDAHCTEPGKLACVTGTQRCGECTSDAWCSPMQRCDLERAVCVPRPNPAPAPLPEPMPPAPGPTPPDP